MKMELSRGVASVVISVKDMLELVKKAGGLDLPDVAAVVMGDLRTDESGEFHVQVAWDSCDAHPSEWADAPAFVVEACKGRE